MGVLTEIIDVASIFSVDANMVMYLLFECASGFALFERIESEEISDQADVVQKALQDVNQVTRMLNLKSFLPFSSALEALENINAISEGVLHDTLRNFLEMNLPKVKKEKKKSKVVLGVAEEKLAATIQDSMSVPCTGGAVVSELMRAIRTHLPLFIKQLGKGDGERAQLGLAHSYSRSKVKFNVNRVDNHIIQAIALLDQLDKDINTFSMRMREWYSWHFPELGKIVTDNVEFAHVIIFVQNKSSLKEEQLPELAENLDEDEEKARRIFDAARSSMGTDISEFDMTNVTRFAKKIINLAEYRKSLHEYLVSKMDVVAPSVLSLMGEQVGARLISHAGSLTNLAKYPASTVQILGAEKALFRALKTRGNTPKYGLIYNSSFIGRATAKNKGRISRYLANKCSIAARLDSFSDNPSKVYGDKLKEQVEERLEFYNSGKTPRKNLDVMREAVKATGGKKEKKNKKQEEEEEDSMDVEGKKDKKKKDKKKDKKRKRDDRNGESPKKKKK